MLTVLPGTTLSVKESFIDDYGEPIIPDYTPVIFLIDNVGDIVTSTNAVTGTVAGTWVGDVTVPKIDSRDTVEFTIKWELESSGIRYVSKENIIVEPSLEERETEFVALFGDANFTITVPFVTSPADLPEVTFELFEENTRLYSITSSDTSIKYSVNNYTTNISLPLTVPSASLSPRLCLVRYNRVGKLVPETLTYKIWVVTPAVLNAVSQLENFINKSRISNVIPELRYATSDLLLALFKGLEMFNSIPPTLSTFTGTNMQGVLLDSWLICSAITILNMQYMAEGSLAFDFSGQSVSLNIDRTQYIDAMLGRLDAMLENQVKPLKHLLGKAGITSGDGSAGNKSLSGAGNFGTLTLTLSPTTRFVGGRFTSTGFKRYW